MRRTSTGTWHDDPAHFRRVSRRDFLYVGLAGGLGLTLADLFRLEAAEAKAAPRKEGKAKSLIHIFMPGGMAHQESWDPKPLAPLEYRGDMGTVKTKLDGVYFNECLKHTAGVADKSLYPRMRAAGLADLVCFPTMVTLDRPGGPIWRNREDHILSLLMPDELPVWHAAHDRAAAERLLFMAHPLHCAVGTKPGSAVG